MMSDWIQPGEAMRLSTDAMVVTIAEQSDGWLTLHVEPRGEGTVLDEPTVRIANGPVGAFTIDLEATKTVAVR